MEKKKAGRPKKVVPPTPKKTVKNAAYYKQAFEELREAYDSLCAKNLKLHHGNEQLFQKAEVAQKKNEDLFNLVKEQVDTTIDALIQVELNTGKFSALDAIYHVSMIERVIESKFNSETEE
jgi:hypothetical protein